nr:ribosome biogenesis protein BMS1 homolog [Ipomoea batatas]
MEQSFISLFGKKPNTSSVSQLEAKDLPGQEADIDNMDDSESSDGEGDHSDDVSDEENDIRSEQGTISNNGFREQADFHDGRMRRKAIFDNDNDLDDAEVCVRITSKLPPPPIILVGE